MLHKASPSVASGRLEADGLCVPFPPCRDEPHAIFRLNDNTVHWTLAGGMGGISELKRSGDPGSLAGSPIIGPHSAPPLLNVTAKVRRDFIFSSSFMTTPSHSWYILNLSRPISPSISLVLSPSFSLHIYVYIPPVDSILHVHLFSLPSTHQIEGEDELKTKPAVGFLPTLPAFHFLKPPLLLTFPVSLSFCPPLFLC